MLPEFDEEGRIVPLGLTNKKDFVKGKSIYVCIKGHEGYIFDIEDYDLFVDDFCYKGNVSISESGYLMISTGVWGIFEEPFHRFIMAEKILKFSTENNFALSNIEIHHINFNHKDNRKENLRCMTIKEHEFLHREDRDWNTLRKNMSDVWRDGKTEDHYRKFTIIFIVLVCAENMILRINV